MKLPKYKRSMLILVSLALIFALGVTTSVAQEKAVDSMRPDRQITEGVVIGALNRTTNTFYWKGIPYAKPPVRDLRWKAPKNPKNVRHL